MTKLVGTRCKVRVHGKEEQNGGFLVRIGSPQYDPNPESENGRFFTATPNIQVTLGIVNKAGADQLIEGKEYYMDFIPVNQGEELPEA